MNMRKRNAFWRTVNVLLMLCNLLSVQTVFACAAMGDQVFAEPCCPEMHQSQHEHSSCCTAVSHWGPQIVASDHSVDHADTLPKNTIHPLFIPWLVSYLLPTPSIVRPHYPPPPAAIAASNTHTYLLTQRLRI